ncbi:MAG TPA: multicopper oxidase domain-containing protein, partial [Acidimicrobiia bacterium]|nr:multicopper oxidase domain-containing protein [Acidimicrobiia bacterium]
MIDLVARPVRMRIGDANVKMLGYDGSIPGPTLHVTQGSQATVVFRNETELPTTVHWHGLRHDNHFDGVPQGHHRGMQPPVGPHETYTYDLRFPDPGIFWYHPHIREDYGQEQGLYGAILVEPIEPAYWAPVDHEIPLVLDDILIEDDDVTSFDTTESDHTLMGRFGNVMLANGDANFTTTVRVGEVARLYLINAANTRTFDFAIPGARMKLVGADNGRVEKEALVDGVVLAPSERAIVDVLFERAGLLAMEHRTPNRVYPVGRVVVQEGWRSRPSQRAREFWTLRHSPELAQARTELASEPARPPAMSITFTGLMDGMTVHHGKVSLAREP